MVLHRILGQIEVGVFQGGGQRHQLVHQNLVLQRHLGNLARIKTGDLEGFVLFALHLNTLATEQLAEPGDLRGADPNLGLLGAGEDLRNRCVGDDLPSANHNQVICRQRHFTHEVR